MAGGHARLAEVLAGLSLVTDLGLGRPQESTLRAIYVACLLAERLGLAEAERSDLFYVGVLGGVGCVADGHDLASILGGDEIALKGAMPSAAGDPIKLLGLLLRHAGSSESTLARPLALARTLSGVGTFMEGLRAHCEVGAVFAQRLGLSMGTQQGLLATSESWNGRGVRRMRGEAIPVSVRVLSVAYIGEVFYGLAGAAAAVNVVRAQAGRFFDPVVAHAFLDLVASDPPWNAMESPSLWDDVLSLEPVSRRVTIGTNQIDEVALAFADFADLKAPYLVGHSRGVAGLAEQAARRLRLQEEAIVLIRRAGLTQDVGRASIPNWILDRPRALSPAEWERVRLHPYYSERVLTRAGPLAPCALMASSHHERLDGSGYHRGLRLAQLPIEARLLAAADVYHALTENRPHRPGRSASNAVAVLREEARRGSLDSDCAEAIWEAARAAPPRRTRSLPGLSEREVEILRLLTRGHSKRDIARQLFISETTARHHVEHIYDKLGVSTRAGAVMQAVARGLADQLSSE